MGFRFGKWGWGDYEEEGVVGREGSYAESR